MNSPFNPRSYFYPFRWFLVFAAALMAMLAYTDYTGWRIFSFTQQEHWSASGPSGHK